jgi:hypothetical protein
MKISSLPLHYALKALVRKKAVDDNRIMTKSAFPFIGLRHAPMLIDGRRLSVFHLRCLDDGIESTFRKASTVEQHGIFRPAGDRQVAAP